jgi:putative ABC transport system substrate-binding protein
MWLSAVGLFITIALSLLVVPRVINAQQPVKVPLIGILSPASPPSEAERQQSPFWQKLRELGWQEGHTSAVERRYAEGKLDRLPDLAAELVRLPVHILFVGGALASAQAAQHATTTIPIVFTNFFDPVGYGLVASLARPGGNITGVTADPGPEIVGKDLELLKAAVPTVFRVAMLVGQERLPISEAQEQLLERVARELGLTLRYFYVTRSEAITASVFPAITADASPIDALWVAGERVFAYRREIAAFALQHRLPMIGLLRSYAEAGALLSYGATQREMQGRAAVLVDKILKGAKPADLPVEQPMKFDLDVYFINPTPVYFGVDKI